MLRDVEVTESLLWRLDIRIIHPLFPDGVVSGALGAILSFVEIVEVKAGFVSGSLRQKRPYGYGLNEAKRKGHRIVQEMTSSKEGSEKSWVVGAQVVLPPRLVRCINLSSGALRNHDNLHPGSLRQIPDPSRQIPFPVSRLQQSCKPSSGTDAITDPTDCSREPHIICVYVAIWNDLPVEM